MDPGVNPLRRLPAAQRFQTMLFLGIMWTNVFCVGAGAWIWFGELVVFHVLLATGTVMTGAVFRNASLALAYRTYRHYPLRDGTARYDDVWRG